MDTEKERIRQAKAQEFEEAVKAKTSIMVENTNKENMSVPMQGNGNVAGFNDQLQFGHKPMPQTLGGEDNEMRWHLNSKLESPNSPYELRNRLCHSRNYGKRHLF